MGNTDEQVVIAFDVGTQSTRASLINNQGEILHLSQQKHEPAYFSLQPDWAEQDPDFYYDKIVAATNELKIAAGAALWSKIAGVTITTMRDTPVLLDRNRKPLRPAFVWLDRRRASAEPKLSFPKRLLFRIAGMQEVVKQQFQFTPCNWVREHEPEIWERTDKYVFLSTYLIYRLTGELRDSISGLTGHVPFDHQRGDWMGPNNLIRFVFDIERDKLCDFVPAGTILGTITREAADMTGLKQGLPLYAAGADKACEILGLGCIEADKAAISFGTSATIAFTTERYRTPERFVPSYSAVMPGFYNPEIQIYRGYWLLSWFIREFATAEAIQAAKLEISTEELLNSSLEQIPAGCDGLFFQPYFTPNITRPYARGSVIGFSDTHTHSHVYRSIIEGINFALISAKNIMEKRVKTKINSLYLGGGGSRSKEICQITADMFGLPTYRSGTNEVAGIGSAIAAFVGLGVFSDYDEGVSHMVHIRDEFWPDRRQHQIYREIFEDIFSDIYKRLASLYKKHSKNSARRNSQNI